MNIDKPKKLLEFITFPQCILAMLLALVFVQTNEVLAIQLIIVFVLEFILNIAVVIYYIRNKNRETIEPRALYAFLAGFLAIFSCGVVIIFEEFASASVISPETLYLLCNSISMIYLSAAIIKQTNLEEKLSLATTIGLCLALPVAIYLLLESSYYSLGDIGIVLAIGLLCLLLFLLGKLAYMLYTKNIQSGQVKSMTTGYSVKYRMFVFIVAVLLPQVGLLVNNDLFWGGVLGDFSSKWFYLIAAINGVLLLIDIDKTQYKMPVFYLKAVGFTFIFYFALIFIPYMPYAIIGIIFYGLGLLVYVPATVFAVQVKQLSRDFKLLNHTFRKRTVMFAMVAGFLTLPAILTVNFTVDRVNFDGAMAYVNLNQSAQREVNLDRLNRSVSQIENSMVSVRQRESLTFTSGTPLISTVYRYIALNDMFFTEGTVAKLQKIFMPEEVVSTSEVMRRDPEPNQDFETKFSVNTVEYDSQTGAYKAWVDLEITPLNDRWGSEYRTKFILPDGCFVTDYYLYVGSEKKRGIITDKRAAQTAYERIIRTPKDPGIIYYDSDNTLSLRVFPFNGSETRRTGFQIMYSQNETLTIEGQTIDLTTERPIREPLHLEGVQFIPADYKKTLPAMEREPLYYFLLDAGDVASYPEHLELAKRYAEDRNIHNAKYYAVSYQAEEVTDLVADIPRVDTKGGFNTAYAMDAIFSSVPSGSFPIMLLVTENINRAVALEKNQLAKAFPEIDCYYRLNHDLSLTPYRFSDLERLLEVSEPFIAKALNYNGIAVSDDGNSETVFTEPDFAVYTGNQYTNAFILQKNTFAAETNEVQVSLIKEAMGQRILTKNTAFIVMETKEQEDMLLSLQEKFLSGGGTETPSVMMSETKWGAIIVILGIVAILRYRSAMNRKTYTE